MMAFAAQAGLAFFAWWMTRSDDEKRTLEAAFWRQVEQTAMRVAKQASDIAASAEAFYRQSVSV
jgi:uncharacterized membrane protein